MQDENVVLVDYVGENPAYNGLKIFKQADYHDFPVRMSNYSGQEIEELLNQLKALEQKKIDRSGQ